MPSPSRKKDPTPSAGGGVQVSRVLFMNKGKLKQEIDAASASVRCGEEGSFGLVQYKMAASIW